MTKEWALEIANKIDEIERKRAELLDQARKLLATRVDLEKEVHEAMPKLRNFEGNRLAFVLFGGNWGT
jgi:uncharacterized coiled-coil DUF342 family protein